MLNQLIIVVIVSIIVQFAVDVIKKTIKIQKGYYKKILNIKMIVALIISLLICITSNIDLLLLLGITINVPFVGNIITGIICSGGASSIHNLIKKVSELKGEK